MDMLHMLCLSISSQIYSCTSILFFFFWYKALSEVFLGKKDTLVKGHQAEFTFCPLFSVNSEINGLLANHPSLNTEASHIIEQNGKSIEALAKQISKSLNN